ncbi:sigma-E factor negative regulatory protein [Noviherbaspirillum sp.]|uniref:sigma-E factor negative regulatory protein n=1 Tax=Noviherbaspirillum sp. TaxID=1926288 RepID=UPI002D367C1A|nr:sigma-E factor negative regulatory protein [Noviherbaspirillum sp.]HZW22673.1 sigma-E factor negative regulatory protein [Noviherbaspirillum sp.]
MNTNEMTREQISALADGELPDDHVDVVLAALRREQGKADWDIYHQIGDVLRSDDMDVNLSPGFAARLSARLDAEPAIVAPMSHTAAEAPQDRKEVAGNRGSQARRWALPSMAAAAAMATVAFFTTPQLMVAMKGDPETVETTAKVAATEPAGVVAASASEGVVLRDPRIDDYLMAHQRISPSVYSTAQFARSANFASDSNK